MNICIKEKRNYGKKKRENKKKKEISFPSSAGPIPAHAPLSLASALSPSALGPPWPTFSRALAPPPSLPLGPTRQSCPLPL
jgi:hypothetical protein